MSTATFDNAAQSNEPGVASNIDFALRRVNLSTALDPSYSPKISAVLIALLFGAAVTAGRFEGHILGQLIPFFLATLLLSMPLFLYNGGTIMRRGQSDQGKWIAQCVFADPLIDVARVFLEYPLKSFVAISLLGELSKCVGSLFALAIGATVLVAYRCWAQGLVKCSIKCKK